VGSGCQGEGPWDRRNPITQKTTLGKGGGRILTQQTKKVNEGGEQEALGTVRAGVEMSSQGGQGVHPLQRRKGSETLGEMTLGMQDKGG